MGRPQRDLLVGEPHCYCIHAHCALGQPLFATDGESTAFLALLEDLRQCFDLRIFGYLLFPQSYYLILQHQEQIVDDDQDIQRRWQLLSGSTRVIPINRLRERFCSLTGIMQTLAQRYSRQYNQRHQGRGSIWAGRYRSCLLADDTAILAACAWIESQASSALRYAPPQEQHAPLLTASPLREVSNVIMATDEAPLGTHPPAANDWPDLLNSYLQSLSEESRQSYGHALKHGWALGRAESLVPSLSRMARSSGRGRSRQLHDLNDDLGLCGIWG